MRKKNQFFEWKKTLNKIKSKSVDSRIDQHEGRISELPHSSLKMHTAGGGRGGVKKSDENSVQLQDKSKYLITADRERLANAKGVKSTWKATE